MRLRGVIHRFYSLFGYKVEIRIESPDFQKRLKVLSNLVDDRRYEEFKREYKETCRIYDANDPEIIRLSTFADFMYGDDVWN